MARQTRTDKDIAKFQKEMDKFFKKITHSSQMKKLGNEAIDIIVKRTRGKMQSVNKPLGRTYKLKKVTAKYAKQRQKIKNRLRSAARGRDCNLTLRGTMLNNLTVLSARKRSLVIGHRGRKNQIKTAAHHAKGRPFLFLALKEVRELMTYYDKFIGKQAKKV